MANQQFRRSTLIPLFMTVSVISCCSFWTPQQGCHFCIARNHDQNQAKIILDKRQTSDRSTEPRSEMEASWHRERTQGASRWQSVQWLERGKQSKQTLSFFIARTRSWRGKARRLGCGNICGLSNTFCWIYYEGTPIHCKVRCASIPLSKHQEKAILDQCMLDSSFV